MGKERERGRGEKKGKTEGEDQLECDAERDSSQVQQASSCPEIGNIDGRRSRNGTRIEKRVRLNLLKKVKTRTSAQLAGWVRIQKTT